MQLMGLQAIYPRAKNGLGSAVGQGHQMYSYLLRGVTIERVNQVWSADITYVCGCRQADFIWWRYWTGLAAMWWPGRSRSL